MAASCGCPLAKSRGDQVAGQFWELPAHGSFLLFQERIFLTVSNYIFTAIFVGEMTLKVSSSASPGTSPTPSLEAPGPGSALPQLVTHLSISLGPEAGSARSCSPGAHNPPERRM